MLLFNWTKTYIILMKDCEEDYSSVNGDYLFWIVYFQSRNFSKPLLRTKSTLFW